MGKLLVSMVGCVVVTIATSVCGWAGQAGQSGQTGKANQKQPAEATLYDYTHSRAFPNVFSAYAPPFVPQAKLTNSSLLDELIEDGELHLSLENAIALSLENNLDIAVDRYNLPLAQADLLRAKAGGAARGVAGSNVSSALFSGAIGAGGGNGGGGGTNAGSALGGGIPEVGRGSCCDPELSIWYGWGYTVTPLGELVLGGVPVESAHTDVIQTAYTQSFLTGTTFQMSLTGVRSSSNLTTTFFNPLIDAGYTVGFSQKLLNGFGYRVNSKFIRIAENDQKYSRSVFRQQVIATVAQVMSNYYDLLADAENIHVAEEAVDYAKKLLTDNQEEQKVGAAAEFDVAQARLAVANREQDLLAAQNTFSQDSQSMKSLISKSFSPEIAAVPIKPTDHLPEPHPNDIPPLAEALREGQASRPEIEQAQVNLRNQRITVQADRNALLPSLDAFVAYSASGQAGGLGATLTPLLQGRYPGLGYGVSLDIPIRNREAQADAATALLQERQFNMKLQQARNQVVWDVSKAVALVHQAQGQLEAGVRVTAIARQSFDMEHTKFTVGQATVQEVIDSQSQLATAENNEVKARAGYAKALIAFEQATGTILARNNIELSNAEQGTVPRSPSIPGTPVVQPSTR
ncbi:MAG TPA: TolC family protein [Terriglobia bacterium]|nr:TolC family protein [Terriglobia bacterium]